MGSSDATSSVFQRLAAALKGELAGLNPRLQALTIAASVLPRSDARARAQLFSLAGFRIGEGTCLHSTPRISGSGALFERLVIGRDCSIEEDCTFDLEEEITIGDRVSIGPGAMLLTSSHGFDPHEPGVRVVLKSPVKVEAGALLGARSVVLPGVTIGAGAVVNPGAVVKQNVLPHTRVGGVPAIQIESLPAERP
ncbi:MAG: DapH/DapD/GlmU-related protein [Pseudomonadota bacterium]